MRLTEHRLMKKANNNQLNFRSGTWACKKRQTIKSMRTFFCCSRRIITAQLNTTRNEWLKRCNKNNLHGVLPFFYMRNFFEPMCARFQEKNGNGKKNGAHTSTWIDCIWSFNQLIAARKWFYDKNDVRRTFNPLRSITRSGLTSRRVIHWNSSNSESIKCFLLLYIPKAGKSKMPRRVSFSLILHFVWLLAYLIIVHVSSFYPSHFVLRTN